MKNKSTKTKNFAISQTKPKKDSKISALKEVNY